MFIVKQLKKLLPPIPSLPNFSYITSSLSSLISKMYTKSKQVSLKLRDEFSKCSKIFAKKLNDNSNIKYSILATLPFLPLAACEWEPEMAALVFAPLLPRAWGFLNSSYDVHIGVPFNYKNLCLLQIPVISSFEKRDCIQPHKIACIPFFISFLNSTANSSNITIAQGRFEACYPVDYGGTPPEPYWSCSQNAIFRAAIKALSKTNQSYFEENGQPLIYSPISHEASSKFYNDFVYITGFIWQTLKQFSVEKREDIEGRKCEWVFPEPPENREELWFKLAIGFSVSLFCVMGVCRRFEYLREQKQRLLDINDKLVSDLHRNIKESLATLTTDVHIMIMEYLGEVMAIRGSHPKVSKQLASRNDHASLFMFSKEGQRANNQTSVERRKFKLRDLIFKTKTSTEVHYEKMTTVFDLNDPSSLKCYSEQRGEFFLPLYNIDKKPGNNETVPLIDESTLDDSTFDEIRDCKYEGTRDYIHIDLDHKEGDSKVPFISASHVSPRAYPTTSSRYTAVPNNYSVRSDCEVELGLLQTDVSDEKSVFAP